MVLCLQRSQRSRERLGTDATISSEWIDRLEAGELDIDRAGAWLLAELLPAVLEAAGITPGSITPNGARQYTPLRERGSGNWNDIEAEAMLEELVFFRIVRALRSANQTASEAIAAVEAIELLLLGAALELSVARELDQAASDALYPNGPDPEFRARAEAAERAFDRYLDLDARFERTYCLLFSGD
jgi:hypothetical protein